MKLSVVLWCLCGATLLAAFFGLVSSRPPAEESARRWLERAGRDAEVLCHGRYCDVVPPHPAPPFTLLCDWDCRLTEER